VHWTLDTLTEAAQAEGIRVGRSQVRRILLAERVRWRRTRSWATSSDPTAPAFCESVLFVT
jgi:transposase